MRFGSEVALRPQQEGCCWRGVEQSNNSQYRDTRQGHVIDFKQSHSIKSQLVVYDLMLKVILQVV